MPSNRGALARAAVAAALLIALVTLSHALFERQSAPRLALLAAAVVAGVAAIRALIDGLFGIVRDQRLLLWRNLATWALYALLVVVLAPEAGVNVSGLLLGGAVLGVVAASASQAPLGNFFAGLILLMGRPFSIGDTIRIRSSIAGGAEYEGTVVDARAFYTTLVTAGGELMRLPNSAVISSVIVVGGAPLRAELDVDLPQQARVEPLLQRVSSQLPDDATLELRTRALDATEQRIRCELRVRSRRTLPDHVLAEALMDAMAEAV